MGVRPSDRELKEMIRVAMQDRAPKMFAELKAANELDAAIEQRAEMARETYLTTMGEEMYQIAWLAESTEPTEQVALAAPSTRGVGKLVQSRSRVARGNERNYLAGAGPLTGAGSCRAAAASSSSRAIR